MQNEKPCSKCKKILGFDKFYKAKARLNGIASQCKECMTTTATNWKNKNREKYNALYRKYRQENWEKVRTIERRSRAQNREQNLKQMRDYYAKLRSQLFEAYGNKCACCGEMHKEFFAIDHIQGGGTTEKKKLGTRPLYRKIIDEGCPKDKYQILCHNCNMSMGFYGYCPHHPEIKRPLHRPQDIKQT